MPQHISEKVINQYVKQVTNIPQSDSDWSVSDLLSLIAIAISVLGVALSYISVYKAKHLEIRFEKFNKLCLDNIIEILKPVDDIFNTPSTDSVSSKLTAITDHLVNIELFMAEFTVLYNSIEIVKISLLKDAFTDMLYQHPHDEIKSHKSAYLIFKTKVLFDLYDYAMNTDINTYAKVKNAFRRFGRWLQFWK